MYLYGSDNDNIVTYTPEDMILFKESPFASWMERLTLENPGHGISPDTDTKPEIERARSLRNIAFMLNAQSHSVSLLAWEDFVHVREYLPAKKSPAPTNTSYAFHIESGDVFVVDQPLDEPLRRAMTIEAMRSGTRFIVNGQVATGPLSARVGLLMRTSGNSELGDYFYMPCSTRHNATLHDRLRLCFAADLLHDLQGKLAPQILIMSDSDGLKSLQTEDYIYHYRAVKHRFMTQQRAFRKHRMPDPMDSAHFGRWSRCANELIKHRAMSHGHQGQRDMAGESGNGEPLQSLKNPMAGQSDLEHRQDGRATNCVRTFDSRLITNTEAR
jgi:hypothetical protein